MKRSTTLLLAALLCAPACDSSGDSAEAAANADQPNSNAKPAAKPTPATDPDPGTVTPDPAKPSAEKQRVVASGLDLGERFKAFDITNCESGEDYCQVCRFGGSPKIMAVGTIDDKAFRKDLQDIEAIVAKYGEDKVKAFAVIAESGQGSLSTPLATKAELQAKAKALRTELGLSMPVVIPAADGEEPNSVWENHYQVTQSRTVMFADARNTVKYSQIAPDNLGALDSAIAAAVGS